MAAPFIFVGHHSIKEGKLDEFKEYDRKLTEFVETNEPRMIHFGTYINDEGTEATKVQIHPDASSMEFHMQVAGERFMQVYEFLEATRSIEVYGEMSDAVLEQMNQMAGADVPVSVKRDYSSGFYRMR